MQTLETPPWATVETNIEYHNRDAIGSSMLKTARKSLKSYHKAHIAKTEERIETVPMKVGTIVHTIALEGVDALGDKYMILGPEDGPINKSTDKLYGRATKAFTEWMEENSGGREVVLPDDVELAMALYNHPDVKDMLTNPGWAELSVVVDMYGMTCQARPDRIFIIGSDFIFELKSCADINWFPYQYREMGYQYQNAWYRSVIYEACMKNMEVFVGAVEKTDAKRVGAWHVDPVMLDELAKENDQTLLSIKNSTELDIWPAGHLEGIGELNAESVGKPRWN